jgi:hypothetical protein
MIATKNKKTSAAFQNKNKENNFYGCQSYQMPLSAMNLNTI